MAPRLLIGTLFGIRIRDRAWLEHRLVLLSAITAPSLLAQEDQGFEWAIFVGPACPEDIRNALEAVLAPFGGRAFLVPRGPGAAAALPTLARERGLVDVDGYALTGRIDDDDAWHRCTVGTVRERVVAWGACRAGTPGFGLTFENGLVWVMYDMLDMDLLQREGRRVICKSSVRPWQHPFTSMSVFVCSRPSDEIGAVSAQHSRVPKVMASRGFALERVQSDDPMWLYCRHKQAGGPIQKSPADAVPMTLTDLATEFGLDEARTSDYLSTVDRHRYSVVSRVGGRLILLERELREVDRQIDESKPNDVSLDRLRHRRSELSEELARISANVVGSPPL